MVHPVGGAHGVPAALVDKVDEAKQSLVDFRDRFLTVIGGPVNISQLPPEFQALFGRATNIRTTIDATDSATFASTPGSVGGLERYVHSLGALVKVLENAKKSQGWEDIITHLDDPPLAGAIGGLTTQFANSIEEMEKLLGIN